MSRTRVVIATDLSDNSKAAEETGCALAKGMGAEVTLLTCYDLWPFVPPQAISTVAHIDATIERDMVRAIQRHLEEIEAARLSALDSVTLEALRSNNPAIAICDYAKEHGAQWIVVGTHGWTGLRRLLIGSVAERVVRHAHCSVVVARSE